MPITKIPVAEFADLKLGDFVDYTDRFGFRIHAHCVSQTGDQWIVSHGNRADTIRSRDFIEAFRLDYTLF